MKTIMQGELVLQKINDRELIGAEKVKNYVVSHSETGHHHVLEGDVMVLEREGKDTLIEVLQDTELVHRKSTDKHNTHIIGKGIYRKIIKKEYDPFQRVMRKVWD